MIGFSLVAEGFGYKVPKGYLYAAIGFSVLIELLNQLARHKGIKLEAGRPMRERTAEAVLRMLGKRLPDETVVPVLAPQGDAQAITFGVEERNMVSGVLTLAERSVHSVMTPRTEMSWINLDDSPQDIQQQITNISSSSGSSSTHPSSLTVGGQYQNNSGDFSAFTNSFFVAPTASFNSGLNANSISSFYDISFSRFINNISTSTFGYLANVSSDIQQQINNVSLSISTIGDRPLVLYSTLNVSGLATLTQVQINTSLSVLQNISFLGTLNDISTTTFSYLSGLTSNIQNQINNISNTNPTGSVISYAGSTSTLNGYLLCDGSEYPIPSYVALFNVIQYTYGGNEATGYFRVPNYKGIFLRGAGTQSVN
jgi:hypothetical protein